MNSTKALFLLLASLLAGLLQAGSRDADPATATQPPARPVAAANLPLEMPLSLTDPLRAGAVDGGRSAAGDGDPGRSDAGHAVTVVTDGARIDKVRTDNVPASTGAPLGKPRRDAAPRPADRSQLAATVHAGQAVGTSHVIPHKTGQHAPRDRHY